MSANEPDATKRRELAGDAATGKVGAEPIANVRQDATPHEPAAPDATRDNPAPSSTDLEDPGWTPEEPGSQLAQEREGVPEGDVPENVGDTATRTRAQTPPG